MDGPFIEHLLEVTKASSAKEVEIIQSLWSGYGKISRYRLENAKCDTVIVKHIDLGKINTHPRGWNTDLSHKRKKKSYEVETFWYQQWSQLTNDKCKIPSFIGAQSVEESKWIVMEDLEDKYPLRKGNTNLSEAKLCLRWLAHFHGKFICFEPQNLWAIGTYWHLDTRPDEWVTMEDSELKKNAHLIDKRLNDIKYSTIVHGDAKLANFCFSRDCKSVAAVDFQYVGGGCGMKDVAYFIGSCFSGEESEVYESDLLEYYFQELAISLADSDVDTADLEQEWRQLYPLAVTDFVRFLKGWMPTHQKLNAYNETIVRNVLQNLA